MYIYKYLYCITPLAGVETMVKPLALLPALPSTLPSAQPLACTPPGNQNTYKTLPICTPRPIKQTLPICTRK